MNAVWEPPVTDDEVDRDYGYDPGDGDYAWIRGDAPLSEYPIDYEAQARAIARNALRREWRMGRITNDQLREAEALTYADDFDWQSQYADDSD